MSTKFREFADEKESNESNEVELAELPRPSSSEAPISERRSEPPPKREVCRLADRVFCASILVSLALSVGAFCVAMSSVPTVPSNSTG